ncbi:hypothetical protein, partial [Xanthomonas perforans]|uniref:hypothetical protein n=1 Tax=Xanthomonas perforans TaxID=442694 RepID=UPI0019D2DC2C
CSLQPACVRDVVRVRNRVPYPGGYRSMSCQCQKVLALLRGLDKLRGLAQDSGASRSIATTNEANRKHHKVLTKRKSRL